MSKRIGKRISIKELKEEIHKKNYKVGDANAKVLQEFIQSEELNASRVVDTLSEIIAESGGKIIRKEDIDLLKTLHKNLK